MDADYWRLFEESAIKALEKVGPFCSGDSNFVDAIKTEVEKKNTSLSTEKRNGNDIQIFYNFHNDCAKGVQVILV